MYGEKNNLHYVSQADETGVAVYMAKVMGWMVCGLVLTFAAAWYCSQSVAVQQFFIQYPMAFIGAIIAELVVVFALSAAVNRMSAAAALIMFTVYSCLNGITMMFIMLAYELDSIIYVFLLTAFVFTAMAVYGFTTKKDLTGIGTLCVFGLFGIIIAGIFNFFFLNTMLDFAVCAIGIVIFIVLTAWDTQKIKNLYLNSIWAGHDADGEVIRKQAIFGALMLYLDFINLFLKLLRILGRRKR